VRHDRPAFDHTVRATYSGSAQYAASAGAYGRRVLGDERRAGRRLVVRMARKRGIRSIKATLTLKTRLDDGTALIRTSRLTVRLPKLPNAKAKPRPTRRGPAA
jgi:hypothetical protein